MDLDGRKTSIKHIAELCCSNDARKSARLKSMSIDTWRRDENGGVDVKP
jgi:hypothetical protein